MSEEQRDLSKVLQPGEGPAEEEQKATEEAVKEEQEEKAEEKPAEETMPEEKKEELKPEEKVEKPKPEQKPQEQKRPEFRRPKRSAEANVVLVGKKPTMSYVLAVVTQFSDGMKDIHIKARGRSISRAVDVAEVVKNRFVQNVNTNVSIGTDEIIDENNNKINVSTIDISLSK